MKYNNNCGCLFAICICSEKALQSILFYVLQSLLTKTIAPIKCIWKPNVNWVAPKSYECEMRDKLLNINIVFNVEASLEELACYKKIMMVIEKTIAVNNRRIFNLNPGIALQSGVIVASHKAKDDIRFKIGDVIWGQRVLITDEQKIYKTRHTYNEYSDPRRMKQFAVLCKKMQKDEKMNLFQ